MLLHAKIETVNDEISGKSKVDRQENSSADKVQSAGDLSPGVSGNIQKVVSGLRVSPAALLDGIDLTADGEKDLHDEDEYILLLRDFTQRRIVANY